MKDRILSAKAGEKLLLIGNEAIVRGALEAGVKVATTYPGTPASEIGDTFFRIARDAGIHFEYSINEKVAYEVAYGACLGGARAISSMKHLGLNVAGDPFVTSAYVGTVGGFLIVSAGEPGCHTSPNEQDHRYFARMAYVPVLDPSDPQEALEMTRIAFELSERWVLPVLMRPTTRVSHMQGIVTVGAITSPPESFIFRKDPARFLPVPRAAKALRRWLIERIEKAAADKDCGKFNRVEGSGKDLAVVTSGVSYGYVRDALDALGLAERVRVLKLGIPYPVRDDFLAAALAGAEKILVVEELEPFIEDMVKKALHDHSSRAAVLGKEGGLIPLEGELTPSIVRDAVAKTLSIGSRKGSGEPSKGGGAQAPALELPQRPPSLCPGCPHRASFFMLKLVAGPDDLFMNDIGCYTLGMNPPFNMADMLLSMGTSITGGGGLSITTKRKIVAFIGDSTFFHSGITGLANAVINGHDLLAVILDNSSTAMTGHQPSPSDSSVPLSIEQMVRACGVKEVAVVDPADVTATNRTIRKLYGKQGVSVIVSRHPCPLYTAKESAAAKTSKTSKEERKIYRVDADLCRVCAVSCGEAACGEKVSDGCSFTRTQRRVWSGPGFGRSFERAFCSEKCPAGVCIQGFISHALSGELEAAYRIIRKSLPLASVLARVCPRPCERACIRGDHDEPVAINDIKRYVLDAVPDQVKRDFIRSLLGDVKFHGRKVAVIGSGPAGLAAAWELRLRGYDVTIFEKEKEPGGLMRWGIPRFRLPREVLQKDIDEILSAGVKLETGVAVGRDAGIDDLFGRGFEAVFIGAGAGDGVVPDIEGRKSAGVTQAIELMKKVEAGEITSLPGKVIVVGGGDAAMDAARTAVRLGAGEVTVLYRRRREEMPAYAAEIADAEREGVRFIFQAAPVKILPLDGAGLRVIFTGTQPGETDDSGRSRPVAVAGSEFDVPGDHVIFATGQMLEKGTGGLPGAADLDERLLLKVDAETMMTARKNVFAGGDVAAGPATVVGALAAGRRAAWGIDRSLRGEEAAPLLSGLEKPEEKQSRDTDFRGIEKEPRIDLPAPAPAGRRGSFEEVHRGYDAEAFMKEAGRCFACGTCALCSSCISVLGCGAFHAGEDGRMRIDENLCNGCGICAAICPNHAIVEARIEVETGEGVCEGDGGALVIRSEAVAAGAPGPPGAGALRMHFAGVGGQGTLGASGIVGEAAMRAGLNVVIGALHGMAQRGGMITNQLLIGEGRSPIIEPGEADIIAGFEPVETLRSLPFGRQGCIVFMNRCRIVPFTLTVQGGSYPELGLITDAMKQKASIILTIDAVRLAAMAGNLKAVGAVMLGFMAGAGVFPFPAGLLRETLAALSPGERGQVNLKAFDAGLAAAPKL